MMPWRAILSFEEPERETRLGELWRVHLISDWYGVIVAVTKDEGYSLVDPDKDLLYWASWSMTEEGAIRNYTKLTADMVTSYLGGRLSPHTLRDNPEVIRRLAPRQIGMTVSPHPASDLVEAM